MKVAITVPARDDLRKIFRYLETNAGTPKARQIIAELRERCMGLQRMPERFALLPGFETNGYRRRVWRDYLIVYRVAAGRLDILRVLHGASDLLAALEQDRTSFQ